MSTPQGADQSKQSAEPPAAALSMPENEKNRCGSLQYTKSGLFILFGWLLWGDFCFTVFETVGGPGILTLYLQDNFHISNFQVNIVFGVIPQIISIAVGPPLSFKSDRYRSRWGRRIPFMLFTMPFLCLFAAAIGFSDEIISFLKANIGPTSFITPMTASLMVIGIMVIGFTFFNEFVQNVYWYLFADVVPQAYMGRFIGLFRMVGSAAGWLLNVYIMPHQLTHMLWIHVGVAALYFFGFGMMCLGVKEGTYPPPTDVTEKTTFWEKARIYYTECMSHRIYKMTYLVTFFTAISIVVGVAGIFNLHVDQHQKTVSAHSAGAAAMVFSPDGKFAITGGADHLVKVWNCAGKNELTLLKTLDGHGSAVTCVAISADGGTAASGDEDGQIRIWNTATGQCLKTLRGSPSPLLAESPWVECLKTSSTSKSAVKCVALLCDGNTLISGGDDGKVRIWDLRTDKVAKSLNGSATFNSIAEQVSKIGIRKPINTVNCIAISSDEQLVATGASDRTIRLWDTRNWLPVSTLPEPPGPVYALCFTPMLEAKTQTSGNTIPVIGFVINYFRDVFSNESLYDIPAESSSKIVAGNQWLISGGRDGENDDQNSKVRIWDVNKGEQIKELKGHKGAITSVMFKPDLRMILSGSTDNSVRLWNPVDISDLAGDQSLRTISGYTTAVTALACKPQGPVIVNASSAGELHFWDIDKGVSLKKTGLKGSFFSLLTILLAFPTGMLVDRFNPMRITLLATLLIGPVQISYYFFFHDYMSLVWLDCVKIPLYCMLNAAAMPLSMLLYPKSKYGQFCAGAATIRSIVLAIGGLLGSLFVDWLTNDSVLTDNYRYGYLWLGGSYIMIFVSWVLVYREWNKLGGAKNYVPPGDHA